MISSVHFGIMLPLLKNINFKLFWLYCVLYLTTHCRFYQCANATENSNLVMKADAVINATVLFKKERLRKISCNDRDGDNVIKLYNKGEVKKYEQTLA